MMKDDYLVDWINDLEKFMIMIVENIFIDNKDIKEKTKKSINRIIEKCRKSNDKKDKERSINQLMNLKNGLVDIYKQSYINKMKKIYDKYETEDLETKILIISRDIKNLKQDLITNRKKGKYVREFYNTWIGFLETELEYLNNIKDSTSKSKILEIKPNKYKKIRWMKSKVSLGYLISWLKENGYLDEDLQYWDWAQEHFYIEKNGEPTNIKNLQQSFYDWYAKTANAKKEGRKEFEQLEKFLKKIEEK